MNNFNMIDSRSRRNLLNWSGFFPFHSVTNYSTDASKIKMNMKDTLGDGLYINNLHLIPDPLKKNLADSIITGEVKTKTNMASETKTFVPEPKIKVNDTADHRADFYPSLATITSFFSGVLSFVSGAVFHKRANSPAQYYDYECFEKNFDEMAPSLQAWPNAKPEDQNKNGRAHKFIISTNESTNTDSLTMTSNCMTTAARCENKLNQVCLHLINQQSPQFQPQLHPKHSQNIFVEPSSIEDCFEDAFTPEDFEITPNDKSVELCGSLSHQNLNLVICDAPRIKTEDMPVTEHVEITKSVLDIITNDSVAHRSTCNIDFDATENNKDQIVSSCEDKMHKLKALLQERTRDPLKPSEQQSEPILIPNVYTSKNKFSMENSKQKNNTTEDVFKNEFLAENIVKDISSELKIDISLDNDSDSSPEYLDPCNYFDEVTGRFYSTSATESEDSFQIVFTDSPRSCRTRNLSDCESEDSFIIFEESPDSCYLSNDVFGDELDSHEVTIDNSDSDISDESHDSDLESDSGCDSYHPTCRLSHSMTRTIGDLTDNSLYEDVDLDEVDCATTFKEEKPVENITHIFELNESAGEVETKPRGLLINEKRKLDKQKQPRKTVHFSPHPPKVHVMRVWAFAAKQARVGHWERHALDRERFKRRIADVDMAVSWVLKPQHRARVMFQRFMPWWNAQKRQELAERKQKEEMEKIAEVDSNLKDKLNINVDSESDVVTNKINNENLHLSMNNSNRVLNGYNNDNQIEEKYSNNNSKADVASDTKNRKNVTQSHTDLKNDRIVLIDNEINVLKFGVQNNDIDKSTT